PRAFRHRADGSRRHRPFPAATRRRPLDGVALRANPGRPACAGLLALCAGLDHRVDADHLHTRVIAVPAADSRSHPLVIWRETGVHGMMGQPYSEEPMSKVSIVEFKP